MSKQQALIIDDNRYNSEILATLLETAGLEARYLSSSKQIAEVLDSFEDLRVIFLDLEMPNENGFNIQRQLRADGYLNGVPIVAYTVHLSEIDRVRRAGFDGFLGKPIQPERFAEQLSRILNGEPVWEM